MDVYNPEKKPLRIHLKIKDTDERKYTEKIALPPEMATKIIVSVPQLRGKIKPSRISQISLFIWKSKKEHVLFMDNLKLVPARFTGKGGLVILSEEYIPEQGEKIYNGVEYFDFDSKKEKWKNRDFVLTPLYVDNPTSGYATQFPVSGGIPLPNGEVKTIDQIQIFDKDKQPIGSQVRPLGRWIDGSLKWIQVDAKLDIEPLKKQFCYLGYSEKLNKYKKPKSQLGIEENRSGITVNTGAVKFIVKKDGFRLFDQVWVDKNNDRKFSRNELISKDSDLVLVHRGEKYYSSLDKDYSLTVEERGSNKVTLKAEGWFVSKKKRKFCKFVVRLQAFEGKDFVNVYHTFIYTGYPENKQHYLYKGKRLPKNETVEAIYIETPYAMGKNLQYSFGADNSSLRSNFAEPVKIFQDSSDSFSVTHRGKKVLDGKKLEGWLDISGHDSGLAVSIKHLWQQFPKGWYIDDKKNVLYTMLWPSWHGDLDLKTTPAANGEEAVARGSAFGLAKTHDMTFYFHAGMLDKEKGWNTLKLVGKSLLLSADPEWVYDTVSIGKIMPGGKKSFGIAEEAIDLMFDWSQRQVKINKWYGMIDFGDTLALHRDGEWLSNGRHGWIQNEYMGLHSGSLAQYLRTGDYKYFEFGENLAKHIMDVDTVHYNTVDNDKRLKKRIPNDYSQVGSQHRHNADHWGGRNEETSHTNLHGILLYYYMTGYERAFDVAKEIGEFFLKQRVTYFRHPDLCPQRSIGNLVWGVSEMYEATSDERYKKVADKWADVLVRGQNYDGTWSETYNPLIKRWDDKLKAFFAIDYTLPALITYHRITGNKAVADSIVRGTRYYLTKKPYNPYYESLVYSYYLSGDKLFLDAVQERLQYHKHSQRKSDDPLKSGMIYQKAYYARPIEFLYQLPYALEGIKLKEQAKQKKLINNNSKKE